MKYLIIPWADDYQGVEDVLIAISKLKDSRGLKIGIVPKYVWFKVDSVYNTCGVIK